MKNIKDLNVKNKKVLVRCDFNVPIDDQGNILDDFRIVKSLPTIQYLQKKKAKIILISHLGEPNGVISSELRLNAVKEKLEQLLKTTIIKTDDCVGVEVENTISNLQPGQIALLENVRFHNEEIENDDAFAKQLSNLAEIYINDAFSDSHRAHASMVGIPKYLPNAAGFLLQEEITMLSKVLKKPKKPFVVLMGGKKVATKSKFIDSILKIADTVIVSGLIKKEILDQNITFEGAEKIIGPEENLDAPDIDQNAINLFVPKILAAKTIVWNGPFGKFEDENFRNGTLQLAQAIIKSRAFCVVGGGETIEFLRKEGIINRFDHISTGGGAMLDYLTGESLPGLKALE